MWYTTTEWKVYFFSVFQVCIFPYSVRMRENTDQKTPNTDTFHAVNSSVEYSDWNLVKHLRWSFFARIVNDNYFRKKLILRYLAGFLIRLCIFLKPSAPIFKKCNYQMQLSGQFFVNLLLQCNGGFSYNVSEKTVNFLSTLYFFLFCDIWERVISVNWRINTATFTPRVYTWISRCTFVL